MDCKVWIWAARSHMTMSLVVIQTGVIWERCWQRQARSKGNRWWLPIHSAVCSRAGPECSLCVLQHVRPPKRAEGHAPGAAFVSWSSGASKAGTQQPGGKGTGQHAGRCRSREELGKRDREKKTEEERRKGEKEGRWRAGGHPGGYCDDVCARFGCGDSKGGRACRNTH